MSDKSYDNIDWALLEIHTRMKQGYSLEKAKQNTVWLEDITKEDRKLIDDYLHSAKILGMHDIKAVEWLRESYKQASLFLNQGDE